MISPRYKPAMLALLAIAVLAATGCSMMNDNPTSADQMQTIRKKEAADRQNFNPTASSTPSK